MVQAAGGDQWDADCGCDRGDIDTVLAVYTGSDLLNLTLEASDDNGAPDGLRSWVKFPVTRGDYLVAVDGVNGASGDIKLNWKLGLVPVITLEPASQSVGPGQSVEFRGWRRGFRRRAYQWRFQGVPLPGATNATLRINPVQAEQAGVYSVVAGRTLSGADQRGGGVDGDGGGRAAAIGGSAGAINGLFKLRLLGTPAQLYHRSVHEFIGVAADLTNRAGQGAFEFVDPASIALPQRFYRATPGNNPKRGEQFNRR